MDLTYTLFDALRSFDNRRRYNRKTYDEYVKSQQRFKGSEGYQKDVSDAAARRKAADDEARATAAKTINECLQKMRKNAAQLSIEAPTAEMVNILQVALSALDDIADRFYPKTDVKGKPLEDRFHPNYAALATGINADQINRILDGITAGAKDILNSPVNSSFIDQARMRQQRYGAAFNIDDLPQREPLTDERNFFGGYIPADQYEQFMQAVKDK